MSHRLRIRSAFREDVDVFECEACDYSASYPVKTE